jgi:regulator of sigma E protease
MEWIVNIMHYIVPFIILLGILVFVHEFGHFIIARMTDVKVTDFAIGFGKKLWSFQDRYGTNWKICAIPLGGYCQFLGDADAASAHNDGEVLQTLTEEEKKQAFSLQNPWKKLAIVLGGPGFNYLFAIIVFTILFSVLGKMVFPPIVGEVIEGGAAQKAGIMVQDRILEINGKKIESFSDITTEIALVTDGKADVTLKRDAAESIITLTIELEDMEYDENGKTGKRPMLGIKSLTTVEVDHKKMSVPAAFAEAGKETWKITATTLRSVGQMISGKRNSQDIGGILRIAEMSGDISKKSGWLDFVVFMALLSINLGLINLFPIPILDGGHVVIYVTEIISGKGLNEKVKETLFKFGFGLIIALMLFATWNDFVHLFNRWFA